MVDFIHPMRSSCSARVDPGVDLVPPGFWYAGVHEANIPEILNLHRLALLRKNMQRGHADLGEKSKRAAVLKQYCDLEPDDNPLKPLIRDALKHRRQLIKQTLNEPTFEAFKVLKIAGVPRTGDVVFSSTATANSGNDDAATAAMGILGVTQDITLHRSSTINSTGRTGVSNLVPKYKAVQYDEHCPRDQWITMSRSIAHQFYGITLDYLGRKDEAAFDVLPVYDRMYHWACISQSWTVNLFGNEVSQWALHDEFNVIITMSMMWHIAMTLKPGGQACLKIRGFQRAETYGLTALLANLFDKCTLTENSRQGCTFAVGVFEGMTADERLRRSVAGAIWNAMDQRPEHLFHHPLFQRSKAILPVCSRIRDAITASFAKSTSAFLLGLRCLASCDRDNPSDIAQFRAILQATFDLIYPKDTSAYFANEWVRCLTGLSQTDFQVLRRIMRCPWMVKVC
jgi:hypothetical protein